MLEVLYYNIIKLIFTAYGSIEVGLGIKYFVSRDKIYFIYFTHIKLRDTPRGYSIGITLKVGFSQSNTYFGFILNLKLPPSMSLS